MSDNELYVVLKLVSGENVMALLVEEDEDRILLDSPICIRTTPIFELGREQVTAHPLCQFSDDQVYVLNKKDVMFCKKMHHIFIPQYKKIVKESQESVLIPRGEEESCQDWGEEMSVEKAKRAIQMLRDITRDKEEVPSETSTFVEGNDTIN